MMIFELPQRVSSAIIPGLSDNLANILLCSRAPRWTEPDLVDFAALPLCVTSLCIWKYTRVITRNDDAFSGLSKRLGKTQEETWKPFGRWPLIEERVKQRTKMMAGNKSFVYGRAEMSMEEYADVIPELASLINSSEFAASGLISFQVSSSRPDPACSAAEVDELFRLLIDHRARIYSSQEEWERDLRSKEMALAKAIHALTQDEMLIAVPLINENVQVALLTVSTRDYGKSLKAAGLKVALFEGDPSREWDVGLLR